MMPKAAMSNCFFIVNNLLAPVSTAGAFYVFCLIIKGVVLYVHVSMRRW